MNKISVYHFHNGTEGGVLSVIRNLLRFSTEPLIENHLIYTINSDITPNYKPVPIVDAVTEQIFYYSTRWNFYYTCRQLAKLLPDEKAIIVAHDWLELGMISQLGLQNRVINFLHGDYSYYYQLAKQHQSSIDCFIAMANNIAVKMKQIIPARDKDIRYLRFPVPAISNIINEKKFQDVIFIGRLSTAKGYHLLPEIDRLLQKKNIFLNWHVVGEHSVITDCDTKWNMSGSVHWYGLIDNTRVLSLLSNMDFFLLPSIAEGMPVSLIEAMKAGVVPLINDIDGGIQELITDSITGFKIKNCQPAMFADKIAGLIHNRDLYNSISINCMKMANELFDADKNTQLIEAEICKVFAAPIRAKSAKRMYGSRLDQKWLPNTITEIARRFKL